MDHGIFSEHYQQWVHDALTEDFRYRQSRWTESVAVGNKEFIIETKQQLGFRAKGRKMNGQEDTFELKNYEDWIMGYGLRIIDASLLSNPYPLIPNPAFYVGMILYEY